MPIGPNARAPAILPITKAVRPGSMTRCGFARVPPSLNGWDNPLKLKLISAGRAPFLGVGLMPRSKLLGFQVDITGAENARAVGIQQYLDIRQTVFDFDSIDEAIDRGEFSFFLKRIEHSQDTAAKVFLKQSR